MIRIPAVWLARKKEPVRLPAYDEPELDICIGRGANADYRSRVPEPADVALLVEVSDWTLGTDRGLKLTPYARVGIPVYWIVNLVDRQVEVHARPVKASRCRSRQDYKPGQQIPVVVAGSSSSRLP